MARCGRRSPVNDWRCSRIVDHPPPHRARDPRATLVVAAGCIVDIDGGMVATEEWED